MKYYAITGYERMIRILLAVLILYGLFRTCRGGCIRMSEIMANRYHPVKKKGWLYIVLAVFLVFSILLLQWGSSLTAEAVISLNYDGASRGLNPNSTRFNQVEMMSDEVLQRTIEKGALEGISAKEGLREILDIVPLGHTGAGSNDAYRVSTEYAVRYHASSQAADLDGNMLVKQFCEAYREWFIERYSLNTSSLDADFETVNQEDYLDICDYLSAFANFISSYMETMADKEPAFSSPSIGETFQSVESKAGNIDEMMIQNLKSYVMEHGLSRDTATYIGRLTIENVFLNFEAQKYQMSNSNWITGIQKYADDLARIVLVPTYDQEGQFYMSQTRIGIDNFAEQAEDYADKLTETNSAMASNDYILEQLSRGLGTEAAKQKAETLIADIESELQQVANDAKTLIQEYETRQANGYMTIQMASDRLVFKNVLKKVIRNTLLLFFVLHFICLVSEIKKNKKKAEK